MDLGELLVREGVVSSSALAHARGVQQRGYHASSLADLLVDLDYVGEEKVAATVASLAGSARWDGVRDEDLPTGVRGVVLVRLEGRRCYYATTNPLNENQRDDVRFLSGARESVALTATRTQLADAAIGRMRAPEIREPLAPVPDERTLRLELESEPADTPAARLVNSWLILAGGAPGRRLSIRAFNPPSVEIGKRGAMHGVASGGRKSALRAICRIAYMARAPIGPGVRSGRIRLVLGAGRSEEFRVDVATTRAGESLLCQRVISYSGLEGPAGTTVAALRQAWASCETEEESEPILQSILEQPETAETLLDRIWALEMLGTSFGRTGREALARSHFEAGLALVAEHGIGGRAEASFRVGLALSEQSDLVRRSELLAAANTCLKADGPGRFTFLGSQLDEASALLCADQLAAAAASGRRLAAEDRAAFGARSSMGVKALAVAAEAHARAGELDDASAVLAKLDASWCPPDEWIAEFARGFFDSAAHNYHSAVDHLRRALALPHAHVVSVAAALANALLALDQTSEAIAVANGVEHAPIDAFSQREAAELERIRRMSPYR